MSSTAYNTASVIIPKGAGYKAGTIYGWRPDVNLLQGIDISRPATSDVASFVNSSGVRVFVGANVPRFDWSEGGSCPSLSVEPQRTNLFDQDLAGSGVATQVVTVVNGTQYTVSVEGSGSITLTGAGTGTVTEGSPVTFTAGSTSLTCTVSGSLDYAQVEEGAYATSIIYTSGSTATRNADVISKTGLASLIGQSEGTFYVEAAPFSLDSSTFSFSDGTLNNSVYLRTGSDGFRIRVRVGGTDQVNSAAGSPVANNFFKGASRYAVNNFGLFVGGVSLVTDNSGATFPNNTLTNFVFAFGVSGTDPFFGRIRALAWYKTALTNSELATLTTP